MKKRIHLELSKVSKNKGYTMRANINPDLIVSIKRWNKESWNGEDQQCYGLISKG